MKSLEAFRLSLKAFIQSLWNPITPSFNLKHTRKSFLNLNISQKVNILLIQPNNGKTSKPADIPAAEVDPVGPSENAFRELGADEEYQPLMHPAKTYAEVTPYSVITGLILAVIFSAAAVYLGLKVGQVFEAAIPSNHCRGTFRAISRKESPWAKRNHTVYRSVFRRDSGPAQYSPSPAPLHMRRGHTPPK